MDIAMLCNMLTQQLYDVSIREEARCGTDLISSEEAKRFVAGLQQTLELVSGASIIMLSIRAFLIFAVSFAFGLSI